MFTVSHISYEHTVHHSSKEQCIEVLPWGTYIVPCIPSCNHSAVVLDKLVSLQEELSNIFSNRHFHSCSTPIHLEMEAPESRSSSVPNSGRLGKQPALCAGEILLVSEEDRQYSSTFLCEQLLPRFIEKFLAASTVVQMDYKSFQWTQPIFYGHRGSSQGTESWCDFVIGIPHAPCSAFAPASKTWHRVTTSEGMKHWLSNTTIRTQCVGHLVGR